MTERRPRTDRLERAVYAVARLQQAEARARAREKRKAATRHYQLGLLLERFLFKEPALLARVEELIRKESPRVLAAFRLDRAPSWFEQPERDDDKKAVDTRRFRLGMVLERLLPSDAVLVALVEEQIRKQALHVRSVLGIGDGEASWLVASSRATTARGRR